MTADFQRTKSGRVAIVAICYAVMAIVLLMRLCYWQLLRRDDVFRASYGSGSGLAAETWRGGIFDSHGHYLAVASLVYDVGASPEAITDTKKVAGLLSPLLGVSEPDLVSSLSVKQAWVPLARGLPAATGQAIRNLKLLGIKLDVRPGRYYPEGRLASAVLGFVNNEQRGFYGVEERYDAELRGSQGSKMPGGPQVLFDLPLSSSPQSGVDLVLTIDRVVQRAAERSLDQALRDYEAQSGVIIVMDPRTGAVLAMAVAPGYDPNAYARVSSESAWVNRAISEQYEPGSVFKLVTMAAALDAGAIRAGDIYEDRGQVEVGNRVFYNWDRRAHGRTTMTQILAYSLNVGSIDVALKLGQSRFYEAVRRFGFGEVTGIDLAGEIPGTVRVPGTPYWSISDLAANSFGQGLAVTPIQMVTAVAALANGGRLMRPYVVDRVLMDGQVISQTTPQVVRQVVAPQVARELTEMLIRALPEETPLGVVPRYTSAGKTGTSQVFVGGRYDENDIIASFVGYLPARDPRFVILVKLDHPRREAWGSRSAAPVWRSLATELCTYMGVPPDGTAGTGR